MFQLQVSCSLPTREWRPKDGIIGLGGFTIPSISHALLTFHPVYNTIHQANQRRLGFKFTTITNSTATAHLNHSGLANSLSILLQQLTPPQASIENARTVLQRLIPARGCSSGAGRERIGSSRTFEVHNPHPKCTAFGPQRATPNHHGCLITAISSAPEPRFTDAPQLYTLGLGH